MSEKLAAIQGFRLLMEVGYQFGDFLDVLTDMFECETMANENFSDEDIEKWEATLPEKEEGDIYLAETDMASQILRFYIIDATETSVRKIQNSGGDVNALKAAERKITFMQCLLDQYVIRDVEMAPETKDYDVVICKDWKVYKRYV